MRRSLIYFWRIHLAVLLGVVVATATLTGALLVGDSVRGSLRDLTLERLGRIDHALLSERFFREALGTDLSHEPSFQAQFEEAASAILLSGAAVDTAARSRASRVQIQGVDGRFFALWENEDHLNPFLERQPGQAFPSMLINESLQKELDAEVGKTLLISFERASDIHREFLLGRRGRAEVVQTLRVTVTKVIPDRGIGGFGLRPNQGQPLNAYISLLALQKALDQEGKVNAIFVAAKSQSTTATTPEDRTALAQTLHQAMTLGDYGLTLKAGDDSFALESREFVLKPNIIEAAKTVAAQNNLPYLPVMTYLANEITSNGRTVPYSTIAAIDPQNSLSRLKLVDGSPAPPLGDDEILLNTWAADDLDARTGDSVEVSYYLVDLREQLLTERAQFRLKGALAMEGLAIDATLTPDFPGIHDAEDMSEWEAPFPVDLRKVRPKDEAYWDKFRAAPKAFVSETTGQRLWRSRFGDLTAIRFAPAPGTDLQTSQSNFERNLLKSLRPEQMGFGFQPVKEQGLKAASGATDFSMLFIGFSLFLIASAVLLVGLLFRLGVEQRAKEMGLLLAVGYPTAAVRRRFLKESGWLAVIGGAIGLAGAVAYAWLLMVGLRTWRPLAATPFLTLHINPLSLVMGYVIAVIVILISIGWTVRQLGKLPARALIAGVAASGPTYRGSKASIRKRIVAFASFTMAVALIIFAVVSGVASKAGLFFSSGALLLISGLTVFSMWLNRGEKSTLRASIALMDARNAARQPGRSMLCVALVSCACFVIVAVGANRHAEIKHDAHLQKASGAGGFALMAESDIPLHHDLNSSEGRFELGFSDADSAKFDSAQIFPFRVLPGEDASCLNLYKPQRPRILGATSDFIRRGGFQFQQTARKEANSWRLLEQELEPGVIPAIGDYNSVLWILHLGLGKDLVIEDEFGQPLRLRLAGLLKSSIFQSELLISEANFIKRFPSQSGYAYFLIDSPTTSELGRLLEKTLGEYGFDATTTTERLASYRAVENTYLSTFQTLGGLGLLLGTLGLGIVLLRNVIERSGELATLRAFGFRQSTLAMMLLAENGFLLVMGILIGGASALIAVAPNLIAPVGEIPWLSLTMTLALVFLVGVVASAVSVAFAMRRPLLPLLKAE
jgi:ABC-type antimicrobial peptide transport system permease subunit